MQHLHNKQTGVEPDKVREGQRAHRDVRSELHGLVDVFDAADAFVEGVDGLVYVWHEEAVGDEAWHVAGCGCLFFHELREAA
jgi:hypothetical protein